jgi:ribosome biogenesis GTPase
VTAVDRGRYACLVVDRGEERTVTAMRARELGRKSVVVGDAVALAGDATGRAGTLARIVRIEARSSVLRRTADDTDTVERVVVANADQLVMVVSVADPPPRPRLVDRYLVAAFDAGIQPVLCLTKTDLGPAPELLHTYADLGVPTISTQPGSDLDPLRRVLSDAVSVMVGHSGVGKSTLVNRLVPEAQRRIGDVSAIGKGRHTSTSAVALPLPGGGWIVDTPGIRSFGLAHVSPGHLLRAFPDLTAGARNCPSDCPHTSAEAGCALDEWVAAEGGSAPGRLDSFRRLLASMASEERP